MVFGPELLTVRQPPARKTGHGDDVRRLDGHGGGMDGVGLRRAGRHAPGHGSSAGSRPRSPSPNIHDRRALKEGLNRIRTADADALPKPQELIIWSHPTWTAQDQQDVVATVDLLVQATESIASSADPVMQLHKHIRAARRRAEKAGKDLEHSKIGDLFSQIDTDGSGRLEWDEVSEGASKLGVTGEKGQEQLRVLFSQVADEWREVDRKQFDYLLISLRAAQQYGGTYVFEVSEVVNALRGELAKLASQPAAAATLHSSKGKVRYATTTSRTGGPPTTGKYSRSPEDSQRRDAFNVLCAAAQKICRLAHHGDAKEHRRRQTYLGEQGAVALLARVLSLDNYDCVFWGAQALAALTEHNRENADIFEDVGGVETIANLVTCSPPPHRPVIPALPVGDKRQAAHAASKQGPTPHRGAASATGADRNSETAAPAVKMPERAQTALVHLADVVCNSSGDARRELENDQRLVKRAIVELEHASMDSNVAYGLGIQPVGLPLLTELVALLCSLACGERLRPMLGACGVIKPLTQTAMAPKYSAKIRSAAALAVSLIVGSSWPAWADTLMKDSLLQQVVAAVELGSFTTEGGYSHLWMACMALSELASNAQNRVRLRELGAQELVSKLVIGDAAKSPLATYSATQSVCLQALWHLTLDDAPYTAPPRGYTYAGTDTPAPTRLYHWKFPMALPHCKPSQKVKSFVLHADRWMHRDKESLKEQSAQRAKDVHPVQVLSVSDGPGLSVSDGPGQAGEEAAADIPPQESLGATSEAGANAEVVAEQGAAHGEAGGSSAGVVAGEGGEAGEGGADGAGGPGVEEARRLPDMDLLRLEDLYGNVFWDIEMNALTSRIADQFAAVSMVGVASFLSLFP